MIFEIDLRDADEDDDTALWISLIWFHFEFIDVFIRVIQASAYENQRRVLIALLDSYIWELDEQKIARHNKQGEWWASDLKAVNLPRGRSVL